jgi:hypothetical protein
MDVAEATVAIADILMTRFIGTLCVASGPAGHVGAKFSWILLGDFDGTWTMNLHPNEVGVKRGNGEKVDGEVYWDLSMADAKSFFEGKYKFTEAFEHQRFLVKAPPAVRLKLARAIGAWSKVDLPAVFADPRAFAQQQFIERHGVQPPQDNPNPAVQPK